MAEKDNILRAKDIIPSRPNAPAAGADEGISDIPKFNLANDILAGQRRLTAARRQRPTPENDAVQTENRGPRAEDGRRTVEGKQPSFVKSFTAQWEPVIADIVARDIELLYKGSSWS